MWQVRSHCGPVVFSSDVGSPLRESVMQYLSRPGETAEQFEARALDFRDKAARLRELAAERRMAGNRGTAERFTRVAADLDAKASEMEGGQPAQPAPGPSR